MPDLVAVDLVGPAFVEALLRVWSAGDAVLPVDTRLPPAARAALLDAMRPARLVDRSGECSLPEPLPVEKGDALVVPTSGSTGAPKGVVLSHGAVSAAARATSERLGVDPRTDRWLACLPLSHVGGLGVVVRALLSGTGLDVLDAFDADRVEEAARAGANLVSLVPTALDRIDAGLFRRILLGGSAIPVDRPGNTVATYGLTETGGGVVYDGVPIDGAEIRVVAGRIEVRGPMLLRAYRDGTVPLDTDGWLSTGDLGHLDETGRLVVEGRQSELIITGGENVWPTTVERVLAAQPGIGDVAVVGRPSAEWGEELVALVVPVPGSGPPSLERLRGAVKERLPAFCAPRDVVVVGSLPRTALGKLRRAELPALVTGAAGR